ncbi:MAG: Dihydroorotate dehydrogenase B (NAD(+)), electron transfer subunit [Alphaproteobacteria bacterium ADurb.BinA305]|nr:MAG: Dihydroorotate dehydrogenase B (NAD(+)), electron transfer subunit [Alphaproteobacteria bacterium ADurb.BinA305]
MRVTERGERIPITIAGSNPEKGTITLVVQRVGKTTEDLCALEPGEGLLDLVGPLGQPTHIERWGHVVCVAGGVGAAVVLPIAEAARDAGNQVDTILGARTQELLCLEAELRAASERFWVTTDDGSYGEKGLVVAPLQRMLDGGEKPKMVLCAGPLPMMRAVCDVTRPHEVPTVVSLNPVMVDGTGMCGGCRVSVGGVVKYACVDGPEFDGHQVDFDELRARLAMYREMENVSRGRRCESRMVPVS